MHHDAKLGDAIDLSERAMLMGLRYLGGETLEEIGQSFGVTRERVRQILTKTGINPGEFRPVRTLEPFDAVTFRRASSAANSVRKQNMRSSVANPAHRTARRVQLAALKALAAYLGRSPTYGELGRALGLRGGVVAQVGRLWTGRSAHRPKFMQSCTVGMRRMYRLAGLTPRRGQRRPARAGSSRRRVDGEPCRRCGSDEVRRTSTTGHPYCLACRRARSKAAR